jgi:hypothetical protein
MIVFISGVWSMLAFFFIGKGETRYQLAYQQFEIKVY